MPQALTRDARVAIQRRGSAALAVGWTLLAFAMIAGIYVFQDIREGTFFFRLYAGVLAVAGIVIIGYGQHLRRGGS
jgi:hypothetical protein